jgi:hypothetical protein
MSSLAALEKLLRSAATHPTHPSDAVLQVAEAAREIARAVRDLAEHLASRHGGHAHIAAGDALDLAMKLELLALRGDRLAACVALPTKEFAE